MPTATIDFPVTPEWVLAGKAVFTVYNGAGDHYTYKVSRKDDGNHPPVWFVSLLTGPDNLGDYTYLGMLNSVTGKVRTTRASARMSEALSFQVIVWAMRLLWTPRDFPPGYGIKGAGRCGRCGHRLTHPDGVADDGYRLGYGPTCWSKICGG